jgi:hypothetical protein
MLEWLLKPVRTWSAYRQTRQQLADIQTSGTSEYRGRFAFAHVRVEASGSMDHREQRLTGAAAMR